MTERDTSTYFERAQSLADEDLGGRYSAQRSRPTAITGTPSEPLPITAWQRDLAAMPQQEQLGHDINEVPDLGMPHSAGPAPWRQRTEAAQAQLASPPPTAPASGASLAAVETSGGDASFPAKRGQ